jgi:hypothetical protein
MAARGDTQLAQHVRRAIVLRALRGHAFVDQRAAVERQREPEGGESPLADARLPHVHRQPCQLLLCRRTALLDRPADGAPREADRGVFPRLGAVRKLRGPGDAVRERCADSRRTECA